MTLFSTLITDESVWTYFLPKLTREELKLVQTKKKTYLQTFVKGYFGGNPDVEEGEMELSESDSKFVYGRGWRKTFKLVAEPSKFKKYFSSLFFTIN